MITKEDVYERNPFPASASIEHLCLVGDGDTASVIKQFERLLGYGGKPFAHIEEGNIWFVSDFPDRFGDLDGREEIFAVDLKTAIAAFDKMPGLRVKGGVYPYNPIKAKFFAIISEAILDYSKYWTNDSYFFGKQS